MSKDFIAPRFILISESAIGDYARTMEYDRCLKLLGSAELGYDSRAYNGLLRGIDFSEDGVISAQHASYLATILSAVKTFDNIETNMRRDRPDDWYSPHLVARFDRIDSIITMVPVAQKKLRQLYQQGDLENDGWDVCWAFQGHFNNKRLLCPASERDLSSKTHPFMLAKQPENNGRALRTSKRLLFVCDILKRGMNNWPILGTCNCARESSPTDDIQFDYGRACRWPPNRIGWHEQPELSEYLTTRHFCPPALFPVRKLALETARQKINELREKIQETVNRKDDPQLTWQSILDGIVIDGYIRTIAPSSILTAEEKFALANVVAAQMRQDGDPFVAIDVMKIPPSKVDVAKNFVAKLLDQKEAPGIAKELLGLNTINKYEQQPVPVVRQLMPKKIDEYEKFELAQFVRTTPEYNGKGLLLRLERIRDGDEATVPDIANALRRIQSTMYREQVGTWTLYGENDGVIVEVANELTIELTKNGILASEAVNGNVRKAVTSACKKLFGIEYAGEDREMDQNAYHIAIREDYRTDIKSMAKALLLKWGLLPNQEYLARRYGIAIG